MKFWWAGVATKWLRRSYNRINDLAIGNLRTATWTRLDGLAAPCPIHRFSSIRTGSSPRRLPFGFESPPTAKRVDLFSPCALPSWTKNSNDWLMTTKSPERKPPGPLARLSTLLKPCVLPHCSSLHHLSMPPGPPLAGQSAPDTASKKRSPSQPGSKTPPNSALHHAPRKCPLPT